MRFLYTLLYTLAGPFILLFLLVKNRQPHDYGKRWGELISLYHQVVLQQGIWIHAASLGEAIVAKPLIKALQRQYPDTPITVTTLRPTGAEYIQQQFAEQVQHIYMPLDIPIIIQRFFHHLQPKIAIIIETELWPNLLRQCQKANIPLLIANGRLSERSLQKYQRIENFMKTVLQDVNCIAAQSAADAERFIALGANPKTIQQVGNVKFDLAIPENIFEQAETLRQLWQSERPIWIAASTHEGEEDIIFEAHQFIKEKFPTCVLIIVPRYPNRHPQISKLAHSYDCHSVLRTEQAFCSEVMDVFIGNTIGELLLFYAAADVTFVGGSLIKRGGHNLLEPAALAKPVITGPHMTNFQEIYALLQNDHAVITINSAPQLAEQVIDLFQNAE